MFFNKEPKLLTEFSLKQ